MDCMLCMVNLRKHLKDRFVDFDKHKVWVDEANVVATFPLTNLSGQLVGYQQYRPNMTKEKRNHPKYGRYYTYTNKEMKSVWGLESWNFSNTLFVTEGIFCAARLTNMGYSAIATLSNNPKFLKNWFYIIKKMRPIIAICDYGKDGLKLSSYTHNFIQMPKEHDFSSADDSYINSLSLAKLKGY